MDHGGRVRNRVTHAAVWATAVVLFVTFGSVAPNAGPRPAVPGTLHPAVFPGPGGGLPGHPPNDHIQHVITVMMENHDYDSYFGTYCQVLGPYCSMTGNGIPAGTCIPYYPTDPSYGCVVPYNMTPAQFLIPDMEHDWYSGPIALDGGAMDGFYSAEGTTNAFGHYNQTTIPIYWDMAEEYASSDNFWGANLSYSLPNHWYLVSATTPPLAYNSYVGFSGIEPSYLDEANRTSTVQDLLNHSTATWRYYDNSLSSYSKAINATGLWGTAYDYWNPMANRAESYTANYSSHFVPRVDFLKDVADGNLPNISWVIPNPPSSDHPGFNNSYGETWVAQLVNTVENSSYWNSTAIFLSWDDYGGWYDHVAPPTILGDGLSFRAPIIVISPYAKENYISHTQLDFMSLLRFIEWQFGLGCLHPLDCFSPLPLDFFNFNQIPRAPILFPTYWQTAKYPMPLQLEGPLDLGCSACRSVAGTLWAGSNVSAAAAPSIDYS